MVPEKGDEGGEMNCHESFWMKNNPIPKTRISCRFSRTQMEKIQPFMQSKRSWFHKNGIRPDCDSFRERRKQVLVTCFQEKV
jgi:hypothetical protein